MTIVSSVVVSSKHVCLDLYSYSCFRPLCMHTDAVKHRLGGTKKPGMASGSPLPERFTTFRCFGNVSRADLGLAPFTATVGSDSDP